MIERDFVEQQKKEYQIQETISQTLKNVGHSHTKLQRTPLGEKIVIFTSRPGLVVGRKGQNIATLTTLLKKKFKLENPQIEISEVENVNLDAQIVAERIASSMERFGIKRFKGAMHKSMQDVLDAGALGVEITVAGKVPSSRARTWRVFGGYIKKCGDMATSVVRTANVIATLRSGVIGITVKIMPDVPRPDNVSLIEEPLVVEGTPEEVEKKVEEITKEADSAPAPAETADKKPAKAAPKKRAKKAAPKQAKPEQAAEQPQKEESA